MKTIRAAFAACLTPLAACLLMMSFPAVSGAAPVCMLDQYANAGKAFSVVCKPGRELIAGLCYPKCQDGWKGSMTQCLKECPAGFADNGLYCGKPPAKAIACPQGYRDDGKYCFKPDSVRKTYPWQVGDRPGDYSAAGARCKRDFPQQGCTQAGLLWHPNACPSGWDDIGVSCAKPDAPRPGCPSGFDDIGVSCKKPVKDRGVGQMDGWCAGGKVVGLLCVQKCRDGFVGTDENKPFSANCVAAKCPPGTVKGNGGICCDNNSCGKPAASPLGGGGNRPVNFSGLADDTGRGSLPACADYVSQRQSHAQSAQMQKQAHERLYATMIAPYLNKLLLVHGCAKRADGCRFGAVGGGSDPLYLRISSNGDISMYNDASGLKRSGLDAARALTVNYAQLAAIFSVKQ